MRERGKGELVLLESEGVSMKIELSESRGVVRGGKQFNRHSWTSVKAVVAAVLWTVFGVTAVAQGIFGRISGTVTDSQGAVVAGVRIRIVNEETKLERAATTDANGYYVASDLPVGVYSVFAEQFGFKTVQKTGNDLVAGARMSVRSEERRVGKECRSRWSR